MKDIATLDIVALGWFVLCWEGYGLFADYMSKRTDNLLGVMDEYRLNWMRQMLARDSRIMDITLIGNLLRSISFFASTSIFIVLGLFTLLKYREEATDILNAIPYASPTSAVLWEIKIFLLAIIFVYSFFKYTWSLRQYNYSCVVVGAAPPASNRSSHFEEYAQNAARLVSNAAKHFNMGLRGYCFGLAALSWFVNPYAFMAATTFVLIVLYRREFRSHALKYMMNPGIFRGEDV
jgi:uncharacterized membrane protein